VLDVRSPATQEEGKTLDEARGEMRRTIENVEVAVCENGYFIGPTILDDVAPHMAIAQEEIFGPVPCIMGAADLDETIRIIHGNPYGAALSQRAAETEAARAGFYRDAAQQLSIPEVVRSLGRLAEQHAAGAAGLDEIDGGPTRGSRVGQKT
jgi:acyl-CoA reductase-like NAD-dependent aldehyde dehydrogenase